MDISDARDKFLDHMKFRYGATHSTMQTYASITNEFVKLTNVQSSDQITLEVVDMYAAVLSLRGYKQRTLRNKLVVARCFVKYMESREMTELKPERIEVPKNKHIEANFLTENELDALLSVIKNPRDFALFMCIAMSGLRVSEATNLRIEDIYGRSILVRNGKGGKPRPIFITDQAKAAIDNYIKKSRGTSPGILFVNPYGHALSRAIVSRKVSSYAKKAQIEKRVTTHTLRHTFATIMAHRGVDIGALREMLGHSSIRTTQDYIHFANGHLESIYLQKMTYRFTHNTVLKTA